MPAVAILSLLTLPAQALSIAHGIETARPLEGTREVPVNVMPVVKALGLGFDSESGPSAEFQLVLADAETGTTVPAVVRFVGEGVYQIVPEELLAADTAYSVFASPGVYGEAEVTHITGFETGAAVDDEAPAHPQPEEVSQESYTDEWGHWHMFSVVQAPAVDQIGVLYTVEVEAIGCAELADCAPAPRSFVVGGDATTAPGDDPDLVREYLSFSQDPAGGNDPLARMEPGDSVVRIYTVDLAGNNAAMVCSVPEGTDPDTVGCGDAAEVNEHEASSGEGGGGSGGEGSGGDGSDGDTDGALDDNEKGSGCSVSGTSSALALTVMSLLMTARRRRDSCQGMDVQNSSDASSRASTGPTAASSSALSDLQSGWGGCVGNS